LVSADQKRDVERVRLKEASYNNFEIIFLSMRLWGADYTHSDGEKGMTMMRDDNEFTRALYRVVVGLLGWGLGCGRATATY